MSLVLSRSSSSTQSPAVAIALLNDIWSSRIMPLYYQLFRHSICSIPSPFNDLLRGLRRLPAMLKMRSSSSLIAGVEKISNAI